MITEFSVGEISRRVVAIVSFGPPTPTDGTRPGVFFQVTIDPEKLSPSGEYIRFGLYQGDEIVGWQKSSAITVVEILGDWPEGEESPKLYFAPAEIQHAKFMLLQHKQTEVIEW